MIYKIVTSMCVGLVASVLFMPIFLDSKNSKDSKKKRCKFCDVSVERGFDVVWEVRRACPFCSVLSSNPFFWLG
jgi:hypothetical protein